MQQALIETNLAQQPHRLTLDSRSRLSITGVLEVESFDDTEILLTSTRGPMSIRGQGLHLQQLSIDGGQVLVDGSVDAISYEDDIRAAAFSPACSADGDPCLGAGADLCAGALLGLGLCLAYDLLRALRQLCPRTGLAADALFGLLLTASFLSFALTAGQGQFRLYVFLAVFLTAVLYFLTLSPLMLRVFRGLFRLLRRILQTLFAPVRFFEISQKISKPSCKLPENGVQ